VIRADPLRGPGAARRPPDIAGSQQDDRIADGPAEPSLERLGISGEAGADRLVFAPGRAMTVLERQRPGQFPASLLEWADSVID